MRLRLNYDRNAEPASKVQEKNKKINEPKDL